MLNLLFQVEIENREYLYDYLTSIMTFHLSHLSTPNYSKQK